MSEEHPEDRSGHEPQPAHDADQRRGAFLLRLRPEGDGPLVTIEATPTR